MLTVLLIFIFTCASLSQSLSYIYFLDENVGWVGDNGGDKDPKTYVTNNGGLTWDVEFNDVMGDINFVNDSIGFFSTYRKTFKTTNQGMSWNEVYSDSDRSFYYRSKFFDENNGYLTRIVSQPLDYGTTLIKTTNGGAT
ncbi:MAG TPA: hypothetical protein VFF33_11495, partial [Ignavibacteriaceae bacterium]|nr:hypothetical protein [Ignavibacteriaceae bacterium]